jgi:hypothetical protein
MNPPQRGRHCDAQRDARGGNDVGAARPDRAPAHRPRRDPHPLRPPLEDRLRARSPSPCWRRVSRGHTGAGRRLMRYAGGCGRTTDVSRIK